MINGPLLELILRSDNCEKSLSLWKDADPGIAEDSELITLGYAIVIAEGSYLFDEY